MKKLLLLILPSIAAILLLSGCNEKSPSGPAETGPVRIGEFASLTGKEAAFGQCSHKGTLLAIEQLNAGGGVLGRKLELLYEDNRSVASESATVVQKLISRD